jgi:transposase
MKMYNMGFRKATIILYRFLGSMKKTSQALSIGLATVWRWVRKGPLFSPRNNIPVPEALKEFVKISILKENYLTQIELIQRVHKCLGLRVSRKCMATVLKILGLTRKRLRNRGKDPSSIPKDRIVAFKQQVFSASHLVSVDEVGFDQRTTPIYGYAPKGDKAIAVTHPTSRKRLNTIAAVDRFGSLKVSIHEKPVDGSSFANFIASLDWPSGTTIIMDNARIHRTHEVTQALLMKGYEVAFTPPYSPDCNPIENVFSWVKNCFRKQVVLLSKPLKEIIEDIFVNLPSSLCLNSFQHMERKVLKNILL